MNKAKYTRYRSKRLRQKNSRRLVLLAVLTIALFGLLAIAVYYNLGYFVSPFSNSAVYGSLDIGLTPKPEATLLPQLDLVPKPTAPSPAPEFERLIVKDPDVYTIGWISDTQHYAGKYPELYLLLTEFLAKEKDKLRLEYIVHTGDLVHNFADQDEWAVAKRAMQALNNIPFGVLAGNHDIGKELEFTHYGRYFGEAAMKARSNCSYYGGSYQNNRGHYDLIPLGSRNFVFVYMSYSPDSACIRYVNKIFKKYNEHVGVLCVHDYFNSDMSYSAQGRLLFEKVVKANPNLYLVMCGHRYMVGHTKVTLNDGHDEPKRIVYELMSNYQAAGPKGGSAYMQFLQIDEQKDEVRVLSYSPYTKDFRYHDTPGAELEKYPVPPENEEYTFPIPWNNN